MKSIKLKPSYFIYALLPLLSVAFLLWALRADYSGISMLAAALSCGLFGFCLIRFAHSFEDQLISADAPAVSPGPRESRFARRHPWLCIVLWTLILHCSVYIFAYCFDLAKNGYSGGLFSNMETLWLRTDAPHYLGIAENWYVTEGDPRFHIVFFPLYPLLIKAFSLLTESTFSAAMLLSNLCAAGSSVMAYELAVLDMDRRDALYAALLLAIFPGSFFLAAPMTESLFLLLSLGCLFAVRKKRYIAAGILGALAAFTRSAGLLLALPIFIEALNDFFPSKTLEGRAIARHLAGASLVIMGTLGYLYINYAVTGDPFTFMKYQREHWSQGLGPFFGTAAYQTELLLSNAAKGEAALAYTLHLPSLLCCFGALIVLLLTVERIRPSYGGYALAYYAFSVGATWLLSGPRYLAVCFPLAFGLARLIQSRPLRAFAAAALFAGMMTYLFLFVTGYYVY